MEGEKLEQKLQAYFQTEAQNAEPPRQWWDNAISRLGEQAQSPHREKPAFWKLHPALISLPLSIFLLVVLVGGLFAGMGGMSLPPPPAPAVVYSETGGAYLAWLDHAYSREAIILAQHVDAQGNRLWGENGRQIASGNVGNPCAVADGNGGILIAWGDGSGLNLQRLDSDGNAIWTWKSAFPSYGLTGMITDGSGGAILLLQDRDEQVYAQKISAEGASLWGESGTSVGKIQFAYMGMPLVSDGAGGALLVWQQAPRKGIFAQRLNYDGKVLWAEGGVTVTSLTGEKDRPQLIDDGAGNFVVAWTEISIGEGFTENVYSQKLDAGGNRLWGEQGVLVEGSTDVQRDPKLTADGSGGCIVAWRKMQHANLRTSSIFAQRIDSAGELLWQEGGITVSNLAQNSPSPDLGLVYISGDSAGNSVVVWIANKGASNRQGQQVYAQKLSPDGQRLWSEAGIEVYKNPPFRAVGYSGVTGDGNGGLVIGSRVSEGSSVSSTDSVLTQRIDTEGNLIWRESGLEIQMKHSSPLLPIVAAGVIMITVLILFGVLRRNRLAGIFTAVAPVLIGVAALFSNLLFTGYRYRWVYILETPLNQLAVAIIPVAALVLAAIGIWKKAATRWVLIPVTVFCILIAAITGLIVIG